MQSLEALKRSIENASDLGSVVRTMKTLAAVSIRQYEQAVASLTDYAETVELGLRMVLWHVHPEPQLIGTAAGPTAAIVFGSDQGMCGQFNEQIGSYTLAARSRDAAGSDWRFMVIGARVAGRLADAGASIDYELPLAGSAAGVAPLVADILAGIDRWRQERGLAVVRIFYNRRVLASSYQPHDLQLLPIDPTEFFRRGERNWNSPSLPMFTLDRNLLLSRLIRQHLFVRLFRACAESLAGENASRIASMQAAERNIQERIEQLQAAYNQRRQTWITEELLDVVTGFEALSQPPKRAST